MTTCPLCGFIMELDWDGHLLPCILRYGIWVSFGTERWIWWARPRA